MSQIYLNGPSTGRAMSAEEFAAGAGQHPGPGCCCGGSAPVQPAPPAGGDCCCESSAMPPAGCGCCEPGAPVQPMPPMNGGICGDCCGDCRCYCCCCQPAAPRPPQVNEGCCCKQSFRAALGLLCDQQVSSLLDFDAAAFLTNTYVAGSTLTGGKPFGASAETQAGSAGDDAAATGRPKPPAPSNPNGPSDNLGALSGSFRRFAPCTCDLLDIDAKLYTAGRKTCPFTASQVSLCELDAVVIQGAAATDEGELTAAEAAARNFRCVRQWLAQRLNPCGDPCGQTACACACDGRDCCCAAGLLSTLAQNNLSRRVSLAAGLLMVQNVTLLGTVGNVLVLSNDADNRLYFVCVNSVQFIG